MTSIQHIGEAERRVTLRQIIAATAEEFGVTVPGILSRRQTRRYSDPRAVAMYLARMLTNHSLPEIGRALDRDHTTVLTGSRRIAERMTHDSALAARADAIERRVTRRPAATVVVCSYVAPVTVTANFGRWG